MRYYFDTLDHGGLSPDGIGLDFEDDNAAIAEGKRGLSDWAVDMARYTDPRSFTIIIRDESREVARLTVRLEITITPPLQGTV